MVKLRGPGLSVAGHGSIADVLTIARGAATTYAKRHQKPAQPRTPSQLSVRALMRFLSQQWKLLTPAEQLTWAELAASTNIAPYHAYIAANHDRWTNWLPPSKRYPATETGTTPNRSHISGFGGPAYAQLSLTPGLPQPTWGYSIMRLPTAVGFPKRTETVALVQVVLGAATEYRDTPLAPGTYHYHSRGFNDTGKWGIQWGNFGVTVT